MTDLLPTTYHRAILPHYMCQFVVRAGRIVEAAPVMQWAIGRPIGVFRKWVRSKGGRIEQLHAVNETETSK